MYRILVTSQARKELKTIKKIYKNAIISAFEELQDNPRAGKPLARELTGKFSYKIGLYRIIYVINPKDKIIYILTAGHRAKVYKP